jgi:hypothetical protein
MTNPVEDYVKEKTAAKEQRKKHELQLWQTWKEQGEQPNHLQPLLKLYEPLLAQKVRLWKAPQVPESAFKAELQTHLIKAFQGYDPARGAAINTHVEKRLEKAKRYNNRYQNLAYIPEGQSGMIGSIAKARDVLTDQFGRAPTTDEIADHLSLTPKRLDRRGELRLRGGRRPCWAWLRGAADRGRAAHPADHLPEQAGDARPLPLHVRDQRVPAGPFDRRSRQADGQERVPGQSHEDRDGGHAA